MSDELRESVRVLRQEVDELFEALDHADEASKLDPEFMKAVARIQKQATKMVA